ncbi:unnamed protein product [Caenorhabditis bovis]|uniref:Checkpoint protein n=1 Tax=Caenorhabditis bovis TaxID=2654633 RepID=A0A8S1FAN6_9PELO|nr:unnamed protein product [Caenorhabditis bovis]
MKFSAVLQDTTSADTFIRYLNAASRLGKKRCCLKIQTEGISFVSCANLHDGGCWFCLYIPCSSQIFRRFDFIGLNARIPDQNFIYLELDIDNLVKILPGGHCYLKIKLSKNQADEPVLAVEVRDPDSDIVTHQVPITVILSRYWSAYARPSHGHKKMSIFLPQAKVLCRVMQAYKNMNAKCLKFIASTNGDLRISSTIEHGEIDALFSDLPTNTAETDSQEDSSTVQLMIKSIVSMLQSFTFSRTRVKMNIISNRMAEFNMHCDDYDLSYIVGNVIE